MWMEQRDEREGGRGEEDEVGDRRLKTVPQESNTLRFPVSSRELW